MRTKNWQIILALCVVIIISGIVYAQIRTKSVLVYSGQGTETIPPNAIPLDQALDSSYTSKKLGISFRYPSKAYNLDCNKSLPVKIIEKSFSVDMVTPYGFDENCQPLSKEGQVSQAEISAMRVSNRKDIQQFINKVFPFNCVITEETQDDGETHLFIQSKMPDTAGPDVCAETITWDQKAGVVMFSHLGSKTGGGIDWPAQEPIIMPDGSVEYAFDWPIMNSLKFIPQN